MDFGRDPRIVGLLSARQIDLDRVLAGSDQKRLPFEAIKALTDGLAAWPAPPLPVRVTFGVDGLTIGGSTLTGVRGDVERDAKGWTIEALDMRAPGATTMHAAGKLALAGDKVEFSGPVKVQSSDPAGLLAWVEGRSAFGRPTIGPMRAGGAVTLGAARIAVDGLDAEIDRKPVHGRLAYRFAAGAAPARLDAALSAADIDLDRSMAIGKALFASTAFDLPGEIALALDLGRTSFEGVDARKVNAALSYDSSGLKIERLSIADAGGASLDASGRVDNAGDALRGSITMSLAAPRLEGITTLADKFQPRVADALRQYGARVAPLRVNAKLDIAPGAGATTAAKVKLDGKIAGLDVNLDALGTGDVSDLAAAALRIEGRLEAVDARTIAAVTGLDRLLVADARPARLTFLAEGSFSKSFRVDGKLAGTDLNGSAAGTVTPDGDATLDVALRAADTRLPRRAAAGPVPVDLRSHVTVHGDAVTLTNLAGKIAGATVKGGLALGLGEPLQIGGRIDTDRVDAAELIALFTGTPRAPARAASSEWPTEPFAQATVPQLEGRVEFHAANAQWGIGPAAHDLAGAVTFDDAGFSLADVTGTLAEGRLGLTAQVHRYANGVSLQTRVVLANADLPAVLAGVLRVPAAGRVWLDVNAQAQGLSPASLIGALNGAGTVTLSRVEVASLDPAAIDAVIAALERDRSLAGNPVRVADLAGNSLEFGKLRMPFASAPITIADGRVQVQLAAPAQNADLTGSISLGLADGLVDARVLMTAPPRKNTPAGEPPALGVALKGPIMAARRSIDVGSVVNWVMARAYDEDAKTLEDVQQERRRIEAAAEALRHQGDVATPASGPAETATQARSPDLPPPIEVKPVPAPPPVRRASPQPPVQPPAQARPFNPLDHALDFLFGGTR